MVHSLTISQNSNAHLQQEIYSNTIFGFWIYLMSDCIVFATLFATYAVLHSSTFGGPSSKDLFSLSTTLAETLILLASSVTCGLGMLSACRQQLPQKSKAASFVNEKSKIIFWFALTFLLGLSFVVIEFKEFSHLIQEGNSWQNSAFLSSFFTLVGTHGLHVSFGLLWMAVMIAQISVEGLTISTFRRLVCLNMFWHFLDFVWIFIFTFVYLLGVI